MLVEHFLLFSSRWLINLNRKKSRIFLKIFLRILALRYRQDSYRHIIETVPSANQPSRANQQYPPPNLWQPNDSNGQTTQQLFMPGIQRPFPGLASNVQQTNLNSSSAAAVSTSTASYQPTNLNYVDEQSNFNRHYSNIDAIDSGFPTQFQTGSNSTNSFYPSQRTHTSPSTTAATSFTQFFNYVPPNLHHHHHHHLSSNVDDASSLLIQNHSLT